MATPFDNIRPQAPAAPALASPRSIGYCRDLMLDKAVSRGDDEAEARAVIDAWLEREPRTQRDISDNIDRLKGEGFTGSRYRVKPGEAKEILDNRIDATPELHDGMYLRGDGVIFKVYHTVHGQNQQVAKELVIGENQKASFEYKGKAPLASLKRDSRRLTLEEAREFGSVYGQCCRCMAPLTHEISIALGIGPKCGGHEYGEQFKPLYDAAKARLNVA